MFLGTEPGGSRRKRMRIHRDFIGGNIKVIKAEGAEIFVGNELRDTMEDWFYWAFCVEGAQGSTLTFHFIKKWVGYYGPAVSHDLKTWHWLDTENETVASDSFTYTFGAEEDCVYFAHDMLYHPANFADFCQKEGLKILPLCISGEGHEVPCVHMGTGSQVILLTARHHACEATGSYVLEGVMEELHREGIPGLKVIAVPFVDYDGVVTGDQGKSRAPWDHNRDYDPGKEGIYTSVNALRRIAKEEKVRYAFDFHSPWHIGGMNDWISIPLKQNTTLKDTIRFAKLFEKRITPQALPFSATNILPPDVEAWNRSDTTCFGNYMHRTAGAELSFTLETPYFRASGCPFSPEGARETGRCFARALREYHFPA